MMTASAAAATFSPRVFDDLVQPFQIDPSLEPNDLLFRLFHEDGVRVYRPHPLAPQCRCSRERIERILGAMDRADLSDMTVDGRIVVTCEFCNAQYVFDGGDIEGFAGSV